MGLNTATSNQTVLKAENTTTFTSAKQSEPDPHEICRPYGSRTAEIIARATDSKDEEHVLWKYTKGGGEGHTDAGDNFFTEVTTLLAPTVCGNSYNPFVDSAITDRIELDTARSLMLQMYQHLIDQAGGKAEYEREFAEILDDRRLSYPDDDITFTSVDVWAWNELGINTPSDQYQVVDIDNNYKYDEVGPVGF